MALRRTIRRVWRMSELDLGSFLFIAKVAAPPVIALSLYQNEAAAKTYGSFGYLLALATLLANGTLPQAIFIQNMVVSVTSLSLSGAVNLLALWTGVKARQNSGVVSLTDLSSSQATICAAWLFVQIYAASYFKSAYPQYAYPSLTYEIVAIVAMISGPTYSTAAETTAFTRTILLTFLTGFGITSATTMIFLPLSCRKIVFRDMSQYLANIRSALMAQIDYMASAEELDMFGRVKSATVDELQSSTLHSGRVPTVPTLSPEAKQLKQATSKLLAIQGKLPNDLIFAQREVSLGQLSPDEMATIAALLNDIAQPLVGLTSIMDIFDRVKKLHDWQNRGSEHEERRPSNFELVRQQTVVVKEWQEVMRLLHDPFHDMTQLMVRAIEHVSLLLSKQLSRNGSSVGLVRDIEADTPGKVGAETFAAEFERSIEVFFSTRREMVEKWCREQGVDLFDQEAPDDHDLHDQREHHIQLLVLLYMRQLLRSTAQMLLRLVRYVDQQKADGVLTQLRLIMPGRRRMKKMLLLRSSAGNVPRNMSIDQGESKTTTLGPTALTKSSDPEHLPPTNDFQRLGNLLRIIPRRLRSGHSVFGFRVACAVMSLAILGFIRDTRGFFLAQRGTWALIMIVFNMSRTSGASTYQFAFRCIGTLVALVASFACYYVADGNASGVLIILYFWSFIWHWMIVKKPKYASIGVISAMTAVVILGYVFEEKALGEEIQPSYPPYLIGPYRFLCVIIGVFAAFVWTHFPYPITESSEVRRGTANLLYLLAKYYGTIHATSLARIQGLEGDVRIKQSPGHQLAEARRKTFSKAQLLVIRLKASSDMVKWQLSVGGAFPRQTYATLLSAAERFLRSTTLLADASMAFEEGHATHADWLRRLRALVASVHGSSNEVVSILSVLSSSLANGQPLPPFLRMPEPFHLTEQLRAADAGIMGIRYLAEPGYAAVAVMQLASRAVEADLEVLTREVKKLVGELDFGFRTTATPVCMGTNLPEGDTQFMPQNHDSFMRQRGAVIYRANGS